jgi:hypothetical protein
MTENKIALLVMKDTIEDLEAEDKAKVNAYASQLRDILDDSKDNGEEMFASLALGLVGIESLVDAGL